MDDEIIDTAPADVPPAVDAPVDAQPVNDGITQPDAAPITPDYEKMFAEPEAAPVDPNAPQEAAVPAEFQQALGISEYVKDATQLAGAVTLADQVIKVQNGEAPIAGLLENFRAQNGPAFERMARESLIPYVEAITGMKLTDPNAAPGEPKTPEQQRIDAIEQRFQQQQQEQQQQVIHQQVQKAHGVLLQATDNALKGTWLEGKGKDYIAQLAPHMGMTDEQAVKALNQGNTAMVDKAVKSLMAQKEAEGRAYASWKIKESKTLKSALPAGKGNPRSGEPELEAMTRDQRIQYLQS